MGKCLRRLLLDWNGCEWRRYVFFETKIAWISKSKTEIVFSSTTVYLPVKIFPLARHGSAIFCLRRHLMPTPSIFPYNYTVVSDLHLEMDQDQSSIPFAQKIEIGHFVLVFCIILTILVWLLVWKNQFVTFIAQHSRNVEFRNFRIKLSLILIFSYFFLKPLPLCYCITKQIFLQVFLVWYLTWVFLFFHAHPWDKEKTFVLRFLEHYCRQSYIKLYAASIYYGTDSKKVFIKKKKKDGKLYFYDVIFFISIGNGLTHLR